jgi:hypothetical protein
LGEERVELGDGRVEVIYSIGRTSDV